MVAIAALATRVRRLIVRRRRGVVGAVGCGVRIVMAAEAANMAPVDDHHHLCILRSAASEGPLKSCSSGIVMSCATCTHSAAENARA